MTRSKMAMIGLIGMLAGAQLAQPVRSLRTPQEKPRDLDRAERRRAEREARKRNRRK